ncbi:hypothetical protein QWI17_11055 [Gilvimarinus sp. SDUM040013]|uniref:Uncharacterized protein n=1 Tax=Gilvimarinus gilvus TaxID=3058038 RepID=A0ABU4RXL7_9GAMM|nr:hypothetical protein [Gilvimarinus sp. SDUM040013]MDO3386376.1 hypothetical protein [Gilvimarinus sp. SDUM040013]MDX6849642.1 hypothetical protein [Gilvimarinus sp. SDUM040013]
MRVIRKIALIIETIIGFGLPIYMWVLGLIMSPFLFLGFVTGGEIEMAVSVLAVALGGIGLWGMLQLAVKVIEPHSRVTTPRRLTGFVVCGLLAVSIATVLLGFEPKGFSLIFLPPVLVTVHFLYLARGYLWPNS